MLEGYKTKLGAAGLVAAGAAGYWFGLLDAAEAAALIALGVTAFGAADKAERLAAMIVAALDRAKEKRAAGGESRAKEK
jgi:hypothetical protein